MEIFFDVCGFTDKVDLKASAYIFIASSTPKLKAYYSSNGFIASEFDRPNKIKFDCKRRERERETRTMKKYARATNKVYSRQFIGVHRIPFASYAL